MKRYKNGNIIIGHDANGKLVPSHGLSNHPLYSTWVGIKKRCYNKNSDKYKYYGGRGIFVCREWKTNFKKFYDWALSNGWEKGLSLDRYPDKNGNYKPSNCRWATKVQQANNKTNNRIITVKGQAATITEFSKKYLIGLTTIIKRLSLGWTETDAVIKPVNNLFSCKIKKP